MLSIEIVTTCLCLFAPCQRRSLLSLSTTVDPGKPTLSKIEETGRFGDLGDWETERPQPTLASQPKGDWETGRLGDGATTADPGKLT